MYSYNNLAMLNETNFKERGFNMKNILVFSMLVLAAVLMACGSLYEKEPVGIGIDYSELKRSPCACLEVELMPELPEYFS